MLGREEISNSIWMLCVTWARDFNKSDWGYVIEINSYSRIFGYSETNWSRLWEQTVHNSAFWFRDQCACLWCDWYNQVCDGLHWLFKHLICFRESQKQTGEPWRKVKKIWRNESTLGDYPYVSSLSSILPELDGFCESIDIIWSGD